MPGAGAGWSSVCKGVVGQHASAQSGLYLQSTRIWFASLVVCAPILQAEAFRMCPLWGHTEHMCCGKQ